MDELSKEIGLERCTSNRGHHGHFNEPCIADQVQRRAQCRIERHEGKQQRREVDQEHACSCGHDDAGPQGPWWEGLFRFLPAHARKRQEQQEQARPEGQTKVGGSRLRPTALARAHRVPEFGVGLNWRSRGGHASAAVNHQDGVGFAGGEAGRKRSGGVQQDRPGDVVTLHIGDGVCDQRFLANDDGQHGHVSVVTGHGHLELLQVICTVHGARHQHADEHQVGVTHHLAGRGDDA